MYFSYVNLLVLSATISNVHSEDLSYVVTSKPYFIQSNDNLNKLQRDFNHDNIGDNEINETRENLQSDCEINKSCGNEDFRTASYDATFKPFPQDELEKILKKYGNDKFAHRISNSKLKPNSNEHVSTLPFLPVTNDDTFDKSKSWSLVSAQTNNRENPDRVGWVTLEPVAWSTSQIQKWKPNLKPAPDHNENQPWNNPIASKPQYDSLLWNTNKQSWFSEKNQPTDLKPNFDYLKPNFGMNEQKFVPMKPNHDVLNIKHDSSNSSHDGFQYNYAQMRPLHDPIKMVYDPSKPTYDPLKPIYESLKPTYDPLEPTRETILGSHDVSNSFHNIGKPTHDSLGYTFESMKQTYDHKPKRPNIDSSKPQWNMSHNLENKPSSIQSVWKKPFLSETMPQLITSQNMDQFSHYLQSSSQAQLNSEPKPWGVFEQNNQIVQNSEKPFPTETNGGRPSSVPSESEGHWVLLSSTKEYSGPERQRSLGKSWKEHDIYKNSIPLKIVPYNLEHNRKINRGLPSADSYRNYIPLTRYFSNFTDYKRKSIPLTITATNISNRTERKIKFKDSFGTNDAFEPQNNSRTARRMIRLTVLPSLNQSSVVTSHNGMIEVENTKLTVDESHREHLARMMKYENKKADFNDKLNNSRMQREIKMDDAMSAPFPASKSRMTVLMPIVIGRRRKRYDLNNHNQHQFHYLHRNIETH